MVKFFLGIICIAMAAPLGWWGKNLAIEGWKEWKKPVFYVTVTSKVQIKFPKGLYVLYNSKYGKTLSPINYAIYIETTNKKDIKTRIIDYTIRTLLEYDEGGETIITRLSDGGKKIDYKPSGKNVTKWRDLHNITSLYDEFYLVIDGFTKARKIDFSKNSFDFLASNNQLESGESIRGWVFLAFDSDIASQRPKIKQLEITLKNSSGDLFRKKIKISEDDGPYSILSSGAFHLTQGYYDLTNKNYTIVPHDVFTKKNRSKELIKY